MTYAIFLVLFFSAIVTAEEPKMGCPAGMIIVQNDYYAKPGKGEEVYLWRIHASDVREKLGLRRGRVLRRIGDSTQQPDVIWECEYPNAASREAEVIVLGSNEEFDAVVKHMETLIQHFDRTSWQVEN